MKQYCGMFIALVLLTAGMSALGQDKLIIPDAAAPSGESLLLPLSLAGSSPVVAMQFDVIFTKSVVDVLGPIAAGDSNHRVMSREVSDGLRRVVVFSRSNAILPKDVVIDLPMVMSAGNGGAVAPVLKIEGLCFALENGTKITPSIQRGPIDTWLASNFTAQELSVPSIYGDNADPDGDGIPNLIEYAVGGSPLLSNAPLLPQISLQNTIGGVEMMTLTYQKSKTAEGVVLEPQVSDNLVDWTAVSSTPTGNEDALKIEFTASASKGAAPKKFMRLSVRRAE